MYGRKLKYFKAFAGSVRIINIYIDHYNDGLVGGSLDADTVQREVKKAERCYLYEAGADLIPGKAYFFVVYFPLLACPKTIIPISEKTENTLPGDY